MILRCEVHDPCAYIFGGVCGNAGLFSTHKDLTIFMQMMLNNGISTPETGSVRIFKEETVELFLTRVTDVPYTNSRALGWDTNPWRWHPAPSGQKFSMNSFGHTGYTGTTLWADREKNLGYISMTNRVYPYDTKSVTWFRNNLANMVVDTLTSAQEEPSSPLFMN